MSSNEVSLSSVAEYDALREKLGLSKLRTGDEAKEAAPGTSTIENDTLVAPVVPGAKAKEKELRDRLAERKEKRRIAAKLKKVKGLGEDDAEDTGGVAAWVKRNRAKQKQLDAAEKRAAQLAEQDRELALSAYTEADLRGLQVNHDLGELAEGKDIILTFEDKGVLDEDGEAKLVNVNIAEDAHTRRKLAEASKGPGYDPKKGLDDEDELLGLNKKNVLGKYDDIDVISGDKSLMQENSFTIGQAYVKPTKEQEREEVKRKLLAADSLETKISTGADFYTSAEVEQFKKKKKKKDKKDKKKGRRRAKLTADDLLQDPQADDGDDAAPDDSGDMDTEYDVVDQDEMLDQANDAELEDVELELEKELQSSLLRARKAKARMAKKAKKKDVVALMSEAAQAANVHKTDVETGDVVFTDMTEFVRGVGLSKDEPSPKKAKRSSSNSAKGAAEDAEVKGSAEAQGDMDAGQDDDGAENGKAEATETSTASSADDGDEQGTKEGSKRASAWKEASSSSAAAARLKKVNEAKQLESENILGDEGNASTSVAAALNLAVRKGLLEEEEGKKAKKVTLETNVAKFKSQSFREDKEASTSSRSFRDDYSRHHHRSSRDSGDVFTLEGYQPSFRLVHRNDVGEELTVKEAFQHLSHKFHGITPGRMKTEKKLKKKQQEEEMRKLGQSDDHLGSIAGMRRHQQATGKAHLVLSGSARE